MSGVRQHETPENGEANSAKSAEVRVRDEFVLWLEWRCETCGWSTTVAAPGFAGDGIDHFPDGRTPCGPLNARRVAASPFPFPARPINAAKEPTKGAS